MKAFLLLALLLLASPAVASDIINVSALSDTTLTEDGQVTITATAWLTIQPTSDVKLRVRTSDNTECCFDVFVPGQGHFCGNGHTAVWTPANWQEVKTFTFIAPEDTLDDGLQSWTLTWGSEDPNCPGCSLSWADTSDTRFHGKGPWIRTGVTCDNDGGNDGPCNIE